LIPFQYDVEAAFINADIEEEVYVQMPAGLKQFDANGNELVWRLLKTLYGLKQSSRAWNIVITKWFIDYGFIQSEKEPCIFTYFKNGIICIICLYVDDLPGGCNNQEFIDTMIQELRKSFNVSYVGPLNFILGIEIEHKTNSIELKQSKYIAEILERFNMTDCKPADSPMDSGFIISNYDSPQTDTEKEALAALPYRELVGSLLWISRCTRPDITLAVGILSRYVSNPSQRHFTGLKNILRYLKGTSTLPLT